MLSSNSFRPSTDNQNDVLELQNLLSELSQDTERQLVASEIEGTVLQLRKPENTYSNLFYFSLQYCKASSEMILFVFGILYPTGVRIILQMALQMGLSAMKSF